MSSDKLDKKIIEAAAHHHPPYDEHAWKNMKQLLDKHLPEEKDNKRRLIFFLLLLLFVVGGSGIWYFTGMKKIVQTESTNSNTPSTINRDAINEIINEEKQIVESQKVKQANLENKKVVVTAIPNFRNETALKSSYSINQSEQLIKKEAAQLNIKNADIKSIAVKKDAAINNTENDQSIQKIKNDEPLKEDISNNNKETFEMETTPLDLQSSNEQSAAEITDSIVEKEEFTSDKLGEKKKKKGFFSFSLAAGPDLSFVASDQLGTTKIIGGIGVGYTFKSGLSVRTGFYSGRKVYSADPDSYHPPPGFSQYYPILEHVDADCKIYEIPVSIVYNFNPTTKQTWFAGAGLSSLFMKKENYTYTYKYYSTGSSYKKDWTVNNSNKHYFSVLTLSGGYQHQLNKIVSLSVEPYIKFPLQGVGYGKVKLSSTGVLVTISVRPFHSKAID